MSAKVNRIFGYGLFAFGVAKILFVIASLLHLTSGMPSILAGGAAINFDNYSSFSYILALAQLILMLGSIIMLIVNLKCSPRVIPGYLWGLGAVLVNLLSFSMFTFYTVWIECGMYMKSGNYIIKKLTNETGTKKISKEKLKNMDWFYSEKNTQNTNNRSIDGKKLNKLEQEMDEWKQLLDSGEIDEITYQQEINRLKLKKSKILMNK